MAVFPSNFLYSNPALVDVFGMVTKGMENRTKNETPTYSRWNNKQWALERMQH